MIRTCAAICSVIGLLVISSCQDPSSETIVRGGGAGELSNIPWTLAGVTIGGRELNAQDYEPFTFLLNDSSVYGDDGCNLYFGDLRIDGQILSVGWISRTEIGCELARPEFNAFQLAHRWFYERRDTGLVLQSSDTMFVFSSKWTTPVRQYSFTDKHWRLAYSNDTAFAILSANDLLPRLTLTGTRNFTLEWYFAPRNKLFPSNTAEGAYGVGDGQSMSFYYMGGAYATDLPITADDERFVLRIAKSDHFTYSDFTLTLTTHSSNVRYEFVPAN